MVILGVDPGLTATGYGIIDVESSQVRLIRAGDIQAPRTQPLAERLGFIRESLDGVIRSTHPDIMVLEKLFTHHHHVTTAALMGHARGAACLVAHDHGLPLAEYPPTQVKKSLTGSGHASKAQVARMVAHWLGTSDPSWSADATDALALAIVHSNVASRNCLSNINKPKSKIPNQKSKILAWG